MAWNVEGNDYHCARHDIRFGKTGTCIGCAADPGPPPDQEGDEPLPPPPAGCLSTDQIEALFIRDAQSLGGLIAQLEADPRVDDDDEPSAGPGYHIANTIGKLYAERTKLLRAAMACARAREDEVIVKRREARDREMQRGATH